jgi:hypothetical protein
MAGAALATNIRIERIPVGAAQVFQSPRCQWGASSARRYHYTPMRGAECPRLSVARPGCRLRKSHTPRVILFSRTTEAKRFSTLLDLIHRAKDPKDL